VILDCGACGADACAGGVVFLCHTVCLLGEHSEEMSVHDGVTSV